MDGGTLPQASTQLTNELDQPPGAVPLVSQLQQTTGTLFPTEHVQTVPPLPVLKSEQPLQPGLDLLMPSASNPLPTTAMSFTAANNLLASISASSLLPLPDLNLTPSTGDNTLQTNLANALPQLTDSSLFTPLSVSSLLLAAGADIISSIASTLPQPVEGGPLPVDPLLLSTPSLMGPVKDVHPSISNSPSATSNTALTTTPIMDTQLPAVVSSVSPPPTVATPIMATPTVVPPTVAPPTVTMLKVTPPTVTPLTQVPTITGPTIQVIASQAPPANAPTLTNTAFPNIDKLTNEALLAVRQVSGVEARVIRTSPPSLHANEQLLSDDSEVEDMDTKDSEDTAPVDSATFPAVPAHPPLADAPIPSRSDSVSPYADDDSFASFLAREVHETASALGDDRSSMSRSPTPASSQTSATDMQTLVSYLQNQQGQSSRGSAVLKRFGVTASCPPAPVQLPEGALSAQLDMTSRNFPKRSKYAHRAAMSAMHPYNRTRGGGASVAKTLDLLKAVLQSSFNMEVKRLCDDYLHIFSLAASNIRENTGDSVPEATLKLLVCKMMEEAQQGYVNSKWEFPCGKLPRNEKVASASGSPMATKKLKTDRSENRFGPPKRIRKPPADRHAEKTAVWKWGMDKRRLDPEKWEPEKMTSSSVFCLGVTVNKALGHAANRGKVYYLHPELFKYACDGDDKTWLYENKYLPVHGGKAFLMIYKEVVALVSTDELYKDNQDVVNAVQKLKQFRVPQFMIDKMKTFMKSVQGYFAQEASAASTNSTSGSSSTASKS